MSGSSSAAGSDAASELSVSVVPSGKRKHSLDDDSSASPRAGKKSRIEIEDPESEDRDIAAPLLAKQEAAILDAFKDAIQVMLAEGQTHSNACVGYVGAILPA
jgi:hypothetical protein